MVCRWGDRYPQNTEMEGVQKTFWAKTWISLLKLQSLIISTFKIRLIHRTTSYAIKVNILNLQNLLCPQDEIWSRVDLRCVWKLRANVGVDVLIVVVCHKSTNFKPGDWFSCLKWFEDCFFFFSACTIHFGIWIGIFVAIPAWSPLGWYTWDRRCNLLVRWRQQVYPRVQIVRNHQLGHRLHDCSLNRHVLTHEINQ